MLVSKPSVCVCLHTRTHTLLVCELLSCRIACFVIRSGYAKTNKPEQQEK